MLIFSVLKAAPIICEENYAVFFLSALLTGYIMEVVYHPPAFIEWLVPVEAGPALLVLFKEIFVRRFLSCTMNSYETMSQFFFGMEHYPSKWIAL